MPVCSQGFVRSNRLLMHATSALALLVVLGVPKISMAQHHGGGGPGGGFPGGMHSGDMSGGMSRSSDVPSDMSRNSSARTHGGLQVGPPGRWWDDKHYVKQLHLTEDQQRHMDAIFEQNRPMLLKRYETLEQEEQRMEGLTHAKTLDESAMFTQIDRIEQARADLGKATTHYQVQLRNELDQDQIAKLEDQH
jgi:Spy/CpxP family protein refolding chaperone